jgi:hypothetical protein
LKNIPLGSPLFSHIPAPRDTWKNLRKIFFGTKGTNNLQVFNHLNLAALPLLHSFCSAPPEIESQLRACTCYDYNLRNSNALTTIKCRTERYRRSSFPSTVAIFNDSSNI